uniref:25S rRNA (uridine-N(3))-methyltransferase BMT5-like domain-containing protein n=1 Tax=Lotharella globosa TaxID=91324 RepID=A0A7S3Z8C5_9EUKA|mmetsp:Transcript_4504/g.8046  ORF Transcript_4504/g.8046 Transcript_4504/m.8046 type:complete len:290 (+) Transcript_4504:67-936(+)
MGKRKKQQSMVKRQKELRRNSLQKAAMKKRNKAKQQALKLKKEKEKAMKAKIPYAPTDRVLLIGEGDFSFAAALIKTVYSTVALKDMRMTSRLVATCLDTEGQLVAKYPCAAANIDCIKKAGGIVLTEFDATNLHERKDLKDAAAQGGYFSLKGAFDKIVFNFPHTGCGIKDTHKNNEVHKELLRSFLDSASKILKKPSEIHVTLKKGEPYDSWEFANRVRDIGILSLIRAWDFYPHLYPGYQHRRTLGAATHRTELGGPEPNKDIASGARTYAVKLKQFEECKELKSK